MIAVTTETFEAEVRQVSQSVLVDFWGPRCAPCLALMPFVEKLAEQYERLMKSVKVNAIENLQLCIQLNVKSLPTFLFFAHGQEIDRLIGGVNANELQSWVERMTQKSEVLA